MPLTPALIGQGNTAVWMWCFLFDFIEKCVRVFIVVTFYILSFDNFDRKKENKMFNINNHYIEAGG